jgi:hypothetical protein
MVHAQSTTGTIYGTVTDPSGAEIAGCTVKAVDVATGVTQTTVTNGSGAYTFQTVKPGDYSVSTTATGFKTQTQTDVQVSANQNVHVAFKLSVGSATESVSVVAGVTMVDTRESQIATTIGQQELQQLPTLNRNVYALVQTVPGVVGLSTAPLTGSVRGTIFSVNGLPAGMNSYYLDGAYDTAYKNQSGGNVVPNPDALQEFRLITSNFDAEFGRTPGAVVNVITRSGTSKFHGKVWDYIRNDAFNAKNYFLNSVTPLKQNQFGGVFGGPLLKHQKAFFFVSYQGTIHHEPANVSSTAIVTATPLERTGDFRQSTPVPNVSCNGVKGVICPSDIDPVAANALKYVPVYDPVTGSTAQQTSNADSTTNEGIGRIDYHGWQNHSIQVMFFTQRASANEPGAGGNQILDYPAGMVDSENVINGVVGDTWVISPEAVNTFRAFYTQNRYIQANPPGAPTLADLGSQAAEGGPVHNAPRFSISGYWTMGPTGSGPNDTNQQSFGGIDTVHLTRGHHAIKVGGSFVWNKYSGGGSKQAGGNFTFSGGVTGNALADFMEGKANSFVQTSSTYHRQHNYDPALYFQDDWQMTKRVNVNLGLRWEVFPPYSGDGTEGSFNPYTQSKVIPSAPLGLVFEGDKGVPQGIYTTSWTRFAPRVGFAADLFGNGRASLRGGYGIFYFQQPELLNGNLAQQPYVLSITTHQTPNLVTPYAPGSDPFPFVYSPDNPRFASGANIVAVPVDGGSIPYVQEYNLALEQQLTPDFAIHIGYVGNSTRKNYIQHDINAPVYSPGAKTNTAGINARRPYQPTPDSYTFGAIQLKDPANNGTFNSLQATLRGRIGERLNLRTSYVWGKSLGYDGPFVDGSDISMNYGPTAQDIRQRFVASYLYLLPEIHRLGEAVGEVINGWRVSGVTSLTSGSPFTVTSGKDTNLDGTNNDRADVIGYPYSHNSGSRAQKIQQFINPASFAVPTGPYGDEQQRMLVGPGNVNTNLALSKDFGITDQLHFRFRAEAFNVFGNVNLNNPRTNLKQLNNPNLNQISGAGSPRILQFAGKLIF